MRRGFKAQAERTAREARASLGISNFVPFDPWAYARQIGALVLLFDKLDLSSSCRDRLLVADSESWSGMTLREGDTTAIVINPAHALTRQRSTLMHELAHLVLKHIPARVDVSETGMLLLSDFSEDDEGEADWLSAATLLPREGLVHFRTRGASVSEISAAYVISEQLCEWRLRMTGVDLQLRRMRGRYT